MLPSRRCGSAVRQLQWRRFASTLCQLRPPGDMVGDRTATVYVTGFLTDTRNHENWAEWSASHARLGAEMGWCQESYGVDWRTGAAGDWLGRWPLPVHMLALAARRSSPQALVGGITADTVVNAARLYLHFRAAQESAASQAERFAEACDRFGASRPYRVVAHSLGCRLVIDALPLLPAQRRPSAVFLCAAAATASHAADKLPQLCAPDGRLVHFFSPFDEALSTGFLLASAGEPALGVAPLPTELAALTRASSHDATDYLGIAAHGAYKQHFATLATDALRGRDPPPPSKSAAHLAWVQQQREMLRAGLMRALQRLPGVPTIGSPTWPGSLTSPSKLALQWARRGILLRLGRPPR